MVICSEPVSDRVRRCGSLLAFVGIKLSSPLLLLQQQDEMKRKKAMHIAQEIMSSEKV